MERELLTVELEAEQRAQRQSIDGKAHDIHESIAHANGLPNSLAAPSDKKDLTAHLADLEGVDSDKIYDHDEEDGDEPYPTDEEVSTLRRVADKLPVAAFFIVIVELCERFAFYGLSGPFQNYLQQPLPDGGNGAGSPPNANADIGAGALNLGQTPATGLQNMFSFLAYIFPIGGAIIADSKLGRYKTIALASGIYFVGLLIVTLTSIPSSLARGGGLPGWIVGALIVALGTGGIKANVSPLVADQYRKTKMFTKVLPNGEKVIVDPNLTIQRIYNIFYWCINIGSLSAIATSESELHIGFWLAYLLPTAVFVFVPIVLILGYKRYYIVPPRGSVILETWRVSMIAIKGFWRNPLRYIKEAKSTGVWNRAKPSFIKEHGDPKSKGAVVPAGEKPSWLTWDDEFVDEIKRTMQACSVFLFFPLYWISYGQINSNLVSQAASMTTHGVPNDLLQNFDPIALVIIIPIMDAFVYPGLRRMGIVLRPILRIFLGFMFGAVAMIYACVVQHYIYKTSPCGEFAGDCPDGRAPVNVWIQIPAYVLIAISEIFASITGLEYAYNKAPLRMKSVVMSIFLFTTALGNALNAALSVVAVDPDLVWLYGGIAVATFITGVLFYACFRHLDRTEEADNAIGKGKRSESYENVIGQAEREKAMS